jgi:hypothetical protein
MASIDRGNMALGSASPRLALATGGQDACGRRLTCSQAEGCWMWMGCGSNRQKMVETCGINWKVPEELVARFRGPGTVR